MTGWYRDIVNDDEWADLEAETPLMNLYRKWDVTSVFIFKLPHISEHFSHLMAQKPLTSRVDHAFSI